MRRRSPASLGRTLVIRALVALTDRIAGRRRREQPDPPPSAA